MEIACQRHLVKMDTVCDYIPVVSVVSNLLAIFFKYVFIKKMDQADIENNEFYTRLKEKSLAVCLFCMIPGAWPLFKIADKIATLCVAFGWKGH